MSQLYYSPFNLTAVKGLGRMIFHPDVTILVGENGSGKSTLLEAIAVAWGFNPEGGTVNFSFSTRASHSDLHRHLRLVRSHQRPRDGFFLRAESFFNLATNIEEMDAVPSFGHRSSLRTVVVLCTSNRTESRFFRFSCIVSAETDFIFWMSRKRLYHRLVSWRCYEEYTTWSRKIRSS